MQKLPFKFRLQSNIYKLRLFLQRNIRKLFFWRKFRRNEDMGISINLAGKKAVVFGIANDKSIAWHIAKRLNDAGCQIFA
ncbi:MAG: hypothetical protein AABX32_02355, partial [Nanoarchaeota archaeon]